MYTKEDQLRAKSGLIRMILFNLAILLLTLAIAAAGLVLRLQWLAMLGMVLCLCLTYGFFTLNNASHIENELLGVHQQSTEVFLGDTAVFRDEANYPVLHLVEIGESLRYSENGAVHADWVDSH